MRILIPPAKLSAYFSQPFEHLYERGKQRTDLIKNERKFWKEYARRLDVEVGEAGNAFLKAQMVCQNMTNRLSDGVGSDAALKVIETLESNESDEEKFSSLKGILAPFMSASAAADSGASAEPEIGAAPQPQPLVIITYIEDLITKRKEAKELGKVSEELKRLVRFVESRDELFK